MAADVSFLQYQWFCNERIDEAFPPTAREAIDVTQRRAHRSEAAGIIPAAFFISPTTTSTPTSKTRNPKPARDPKGLEMYAISFTELAHDGDDEHGLTVAVGDNGAVRVDWSKARCRDGNGTLTHLFFSDLVLEIARAKAICAKCPLSVACLEAALDRAEPWGVWGGELIDTGRIVAHKRPRGRPPKHPRPLVVINEDAISVPVRVA